MPRVSVLLPVRDGAPTLGPCLDSLLGQFVPLQVLTLGAGLAAAIGVYMVAARALGIEELDDVLALVRRRRVPRTADPG